MYVVFYVCNKKIMADGIDQQTSQLSVAIYRATAAGDGTQFGA